MTKSGREIMEIFEAFDLTGTAWSAAQLTGCDAKTVARYVAVRDAGGDPLAKTCRPRLIDAFMPKVEELVDRSKGKIRADVAHRKLAAMGFRGSERSARRAVAEQDAAEALYRMSSTFQARARAALDPPESAQISSRRAPG